MDRRDEYIAYAREYREMGEASEAPSVRDYYFRLAAQWLMRAEAQGSSPKQDGGATH